MSFSIILNAFLEKTIKNRIGYMSIIFSVLVVGILDQTTPAYVYDYKEIKARWDSDEGFVSEIESIDGAGAKIYQMPYMTYPEGGGGVNKMSPYDHAFPYVHSESLIWSFGSYTGRAGDKWNKYLGTFEIEKQVKAIYINGFSGIYIDGNGYEEDTLRVLLGDLKQITKYEPICSDNNRLYYFSLCNYELGEVSELEEVMAKSYVDFDDGFYGEEHAGDDKWRWCSGNGTITITNLADIKINTVFSMTIETLSDNGEYNLNLIINGEKNKMSVRGGETKDIILPITLSPGENVIVFETDIPCIELETDSRNLAFSVHNFAFGDEKYNLINLENGAIYRFGLDGNYEDLLITGLSDPEDGYTWTEGNILEMQCNFGDVKEVYCTLNVDMIMAGSQHISVWVNGREIADTILTAQEGGSSYKFKIDNISKDMTNIMIRLPDAIAPCELFSDNMDERVLALGLRSIEFSDIEVLEK